MPPSSHHSRERRQEAIVPPERARLLPIDRIFAAYNALVALAWLAGSAHSRAALWATAAHALAIGLPWYLRRPGATLPAARRLADIYPLLALGVLWGELGAIVPVLHRHAYDDAIVRLDATLFPLDLRRSRWLDEIMYAAYFSFYVLLIVPPLLMLKGGERRVGALRDYVLRVMLTYMTCGVANLIFPVVGPAATAPPVDWSHGLFYGMTALVQQVGDALGTSFPSTHVAAAAAIAWGSWTWYSRAVATVITADVVALAFATVYTRNHYAVDAAAGLAIAVVLQGVVVPLLRHPAQAGGDGVH